METSEIKKKYYEESITYVIKDPEEKEKKLRQRQWLKNSKMILVTNSRNPMNPKCRINLKKSTPKHAYNVITKIIVKSCGDTYIT